MLFCFPEAIDMFLMYNDLLACLRIDFINLFTSLEKYNYERSIFYARLRT